MSNQLHALASTTAYRDPARWPDWLASTVAEIVERYTDRHYGPAGERSVGPEERAEISQATVFSIIASGPIPDGITVQRFAYRWCRYVRHTRGYWSGFGETRRGDRYLEDLEAATGPFGGAGMASRDADPARIVAAREAAGAIVGGPDREHSFTTTSERQRQYRRRSVKTRRRWEYIRTKGAPVYRGGAQVATQVAFERVAVSTKKYSGPKYSNPAARIVGGEVPAVAVRSVASPRARVSILATPLGFRILAARIVGPAPSRPIECTIVAHCAFDAPIVERMRLPQGRIPWPVARHADRTEIAYLSAARIVRAEGL